MTREYDISELIDFVENPDKSVSIVAKRPQYRHLVYCNASRFVPVGGPMCICLRALRAGLADVEGPK